MQMELMKLKTTSLHSDTARDGEKEQEGGRWEDRTNETEGGKIGLKKLKITSLYSDIAGDGEGRTGGNEGEDRTHETEDNFLALRYCRR